MFYLDRPLQQWRRKKKFYNFDHWFPRDNITIDRIESKIGGAKQLSEKCPFLDHLLKEEHLLTELVHLPRLLELAKFLVRTYNRKVTMFKIFDFFVIDNATKLSAVRLPGLDWSNI
jgi:hypothetical protein